MSLPCHFRPMKRILLLFISVIVVFLPLWAVYDKDVEKNLKKQFKEVKYMVHNDCYLVMSKQDKGYWGVYNSKGKEVIPPYYKKISFEKGESNENLIFALNPNYKAKTPGNIVYSFQRGEILDMGKSEPQYIKGGYITSYLKPIYNLEGRVVLDCQQTSLQQLRRGLNVLGYRVGSRMKINNDLVDEVLICDPEFNVLFSLDGANYLWDIVEYPISETDYGWKCTRKVDNYNTLNYLYSKEGKLLSDNFTEKEESEPTLAANKTIGPRTEEKQVSLSKSLSQTPKIPKPVPSKVVSSPQMSKSDVDINIPMGNIPNPNTFALIIANENYQEVANVPNAINDGEIFGEYCKKTLGLPAENIHIIRNSTLSNIKRELNLISQIGEAYKGDANFIVYYAGHGVPDEATGQSFLLPVDGFTSDLTTCLSLTDFYTQLGKLPAAKVIVLVDACFSGSLRGDGMLQAARGVALKSKPATPSGKLVVFSAAQGDETAYPLEKENHGMFTYWLLKNLKESKGDINLGDLTDRVIDSVGKQSLVINGKKQTPSVQISHEVGNSWRNWKMTE